MHFRLLYGTHIAPDASQKGDTQPGRFYRAGAIIETDENLLRLNRRGVTPKFALADEVLAAETTWDVKSETLEAFNVRMRELMKVRAEKAGVPADALSKEPMPVQRSPIAGSPPDLDALSIKQLQDLAAEEEIDVKGAKDKAALVKLLRTHMTQVSVV